MYLRGQLMEEVFCQQYRLLRDFGFIVIIIALPVYVCVQL